MPNIGGPTQGRLYINVSRLKRTALEKFGFTDIGELIVRATDAHYNDSGEALFPALRINERVIHGKWHSSVANRAMRDFAREGEQ